LDRNDLVPEPTIVTNRLVSELAVKARGEGPVKEAALHHQAVYAEQQHWLERRTPDVSLPYLFGLLTPAEVAARLSEEFEANL
jgi:hypothetical protein